LEALLKFVALFFAVFLSQMVWGAPMIDQLEAIDVNGSKQWLLSRGNDQSNPVILFVHGGPGYPSMLFSRAFDEKYVQKFVVVHWDQRNAGKSYNPSAPVSSYELDQIVDDGIVVAEHLRRKFSKNKLILVGHSWGTMVGSLMVNKKPEYFRSYVSVGTAVDWTTGETRKFEALKRLAEGKENADLKHKLTAIGRPPYKSHTGFQQLGLLWVEHMGFSGTCKKCSEADLAEAAMKNREYSGEELGRMPEAIQVSLDYLAEKLSSFSAIRMVPKIAVPVYFVQGKFDTNTPTDLARDYFEKVTAPEGKKMIIFSESAHLPMYEEPDLFLKVLDEAAKVSGAK
jgi:pimeloyl-ACP methyl ester carboxylesterase